MNRAETFKPARLQTVVFALVGAAFANIYVTQPILSVLQGEFHATLLQVSFSVSAVLLGIAFANLPFGWLADRWPVARLVVLGGSVIAIAGLVCSATTSLGVLIAARFVQGAFVPALTSCLAAHLARRLPAASLNVVMGSYVAATVLGGMVSRLLGGYVFPPTHWRWAFVAAAAAVLAAMALAWRELRDAAPPPPAHRDSIGFVALLTRPALWLSYLCGAAGQAVFSPVFNTMPYRLAEAPFRLSTEQTSLMYLVYLVGIVMGPGAGRIANRHGTGRTLMGGALVMASALLLLMVPSVLAVGVALVLVCGGFFTVHAAAVGALNRKLTAGQGRANALYVLCYYIGAWFGITWAAWVYQHAGWNAVMGCAMLLVAVPFTAGVLERRAERR
jgi:YNFM family putative membrane transporter